MFRIRRIHNDVVPPNQAAIREVRKIFMDQFPKASVKEIDQLGDKLRGRSQQMFRTNLFIAENSRGKVLGFSILLYEPELSFCYLDYVTTAKGISGRGVGAALYEHIRDESLGLKANGLWFECLSDEPALCSDPQIRKQNEARMRLYERFNARPIIGTAYETPLPGHVADNIPHLMVDRLGSTRLLKADYVRKVVRKILEGKYPDVCSPEYVEHVVNSIRDPIRLRDYRYTKKPVPTPATLPKLDKIVMTVNDQHLIHHIRERGYVESPVRIRSIEAELNGSGLVEVIPVRTYSEEHITAVHDIDFVEYLRRACENAPERGSVYPYVFPIRNATRPPKELSIRAGYYCIDTFTPIHRNAYAAAKRGVDCTLTAADEILQGRRLAYALIRPPGHHAERRVFGGFCYFNNAAVAAHYFCRYGRVAILDIDYHHGNGQQDIFYHRSDVLTVSIHGDPDFAYPYFTGFADERGEGEGTGYNLNLPLPETLSAADYRVTLERALQVIARFQPEFLIVALGLDTAKGDPTGTWKLVGKDFDQNGRMISQLNLPTLVVQEGGYRTRTLGINARYFFRGLAEGARPGYPRKDRAKRPT